jgi:hypothetical protein
MAVIEVPKHHESAVRQLLRELRRRDNPKPIERKLLITRKQFSKGQQVVRAHVRLGERREAWLDTLQDEYNRIEDLLDNPRSEADERWINRQLDRLQTAIDYVEGA